GNRRGLDNRRASLAERTAACRVCHCTAAWRAAAAGGRAAQRRRSSPGTGHARPSSRRAAHARRRRKRRGRRSARTADAAGVDDGRRPSAGTETDRAHTAWPFPRGRCHGGARRLSAAGAAARSLKSLQMASEGPELTPRQRRILAFVVSEYVTTGQPVGSKHLVERAGLTVSPSTVRNEFAELEARGLLTHPHTSAGRVP